METTPSQRGRPRVRRTSGRSPGHVGSRLWPSTFGGSKKPNMSIPYPQTRCCWVSLCQHVCHIVIYYAYYISRKTVYIRICITHQNGFQQYRTDWIFIPPRMESIQYSTRHPFCGYIRVYFISYREKRLQCTRF